MDNPEKDAAADDTQGLTNAEMDEALALGLRMAREIHKETQVAMARTIAKWTPVLKGTRTGQASYMIGLGEGLAALLYTAGVNVYQTCKTNTPYPDNEDKTHSYAHDETSAFFDGVTESFMRKQESMPFCEFVPGKDGVRVNHENLDADIDAYLKDGAERRGAALN